MRTLSAWLDRISSGYTILVSVALYGLFIVFVMAPHSETAATYAGAWGSPDGHLFYTPHELYEQISTWGEAGRAHHVDFRPGLDPLWALVYTAFLVTVTSVALRRAFPASDRRRLLNTLPLVPMLADLSENALGMYLVSSYPLRLDGLAWLAASVSGTKWLTLGAAHVIMLYALASAIKVRLQTR
jgi:hypothetical protein